LLATFDRNRGPVAVQAVIDSSARRGRALGELGLGPGALLAVARADNLRREADGQRPRFRILGNRLALTDWLLDGELARLERDLVALADRFREASRRSLLRKLQELPQRAFGELMAVLLERAGMTELSSVKRPGMHGAEIHLSAKANGPAGELRTAIVVRRDGREIGRERVTELRGALHHYGPAAAGWLVTTGQVLSGAREEAAAAGAAPVTLVDGAALSRLCEQHGVAVIRNRLTLPLPDLDLLDALRGG
jgi:restriction endonuclease Mrr